MNRWLARAMLEGRSVVLRPPLQRPISKPIRQAEQTFMLLEAHDAAEVAAGDHPVLCPDEAAREILRCHLGKVRLPAFSEELGELGCPFERLNETDVGNMPQRSPSWTAGVSPSSSCKRMLKTVDRELREEGGHSGRKPPPSTQSRRSQSRPSGPP
ncbi:hypothetical protein PAPYR_10220 [Paratrimastix pyriformis]|uniref:Uncharacterized protein n=1 Tax=Paratrimastix pyriformis TaxID=342808 RepID=A0ABQ8U857_9EUKA|nr:hypothetical protein PAPYR_10220 [Paratrimastix pyriformis]